MTLTIYCLRLVLLPANRIKSVTFLNSKLLHIDNEVILCLYKLRIMLARLMILPSLILTNNCLLLHVETTGLLRFLWFFILSMSLYLEWILRPWMCLGLWCCHWGQAVYIWGSWTTSIFRMSTSQGKYSGKVLFLSLSLLKCYLQFLCFGP